MSNPKVILGGWELSETASSVKYVVSQAPEALMVVKAGTNSAVSVGQSGGVYYVTYWDATAETHSWEMAVKLAFAMVQDV